MIKSENTQTNSYKLDILDYLVMALAILLFGWYYISVGIVNNDDLLMLKWGERIVTGMSVDFITTSMHVYMHALFVWVASLLGMRAWDIMVVFTLVFIAIDIAIVWYILRQLTSHSRQNVRLLLYSILYILLYSLSPEMFGQREHFIIIFILPYIMMIAFWRYIKVSSTMLFFIATFAYIGFDIKVFYLLIFATIVITSALIEKSWHIFWRIDTITVILLACLSLVYIVVYTPGVIENLSINIEAYGDYVPLTMRDMIFLPFVLFPFAVTTIFVMYAIKHKNTVITIFSVAILGSLFMYVLQHKGWLYHLIPNFSLMMIAFTIIMLFYSNRSFILLKYLAIVFILNISYFSIMSNNFYSYSISDQNKEIKERRKHVRENIAQTCKSLPDKASIFLYIDGHYRMYPMMKTNQIYISRFLNAWMDHVLSKKNTISKDLLDYLATSTMQDLELYQPDYLLFHISHKGADVNETERNRYKEIIDLSSKIDMYISKNYNQINSRYSNILLFKRNYEYVSPTLKNFSSTIVPKHID